MKTINERPPKHVWDAVHNQFEIDDRYTIYTYGDTLYNPAGVFLNRYLIAHEAVHAVQQKEMGADEWWKMYIDDPEFRFDQEVEAYGKQYKVFCSFNLDRNSQNKYLHELASHLSSPMYKVGVPHSEAMRWIRIGKYEVEKSRTE